ncbi:MAG: hypothetical protein ABII98_01095 [bacterium]
MKIYIPNHDKNAVGGGWSFLRNLTAELKKNCFFVDKIDDCDIVFIAGPTLTSHAIVEEAERKGKKIVLRVDNIPEDYRNRGTALSRLKIFSQKADVVVYQSEWARGYVSEYTGVDGTVIMNGANRKIFKIDTKNRKDDDFLYVRSSTNENKRWQEAKYFFRNKWLTDKYSRLVVVGNFNDYLKLYGNDFVERYKLGLFDENIIYKGQIKSAEDMARIYQQCSEIFVPFFNDACSNVVIEALLCGCKINTCMSGDTGGTPEILSLYESMGYYGLSSERMAEEYYALFNLVLQ